MSEQPAVADLIVAGGGPAGLFTALLASQAGLRVTVCEPRGEPIDKACGEGLMPSAVGRLSKAGVDPAGRDLAGIRYLNGTRTAEARFSAGPGRGVRRTVLHAELGAAARRAGCAMLPVTLRGITQTPSEVRAGGLRARYLVAADGLHSPIRHELGLQGEPRGERRWGIRRHYRIAPWSDFVEVHWSEHAEAYVTPVGDCEVGVAILSRSRRPFEEQLADFPELRSRIDGQPQESKDRGAGPLRQRVRTPVAGRVLLVGDAAGYVDALTGEGLALAFAAAEAALGCILDDDPAGYASRWRALSRKHRLLTEVVLAGSSRKPLRRALVPAAQRFPRVFRAAVDALAT